MESIAQNNMCFLSNIKPEVFVVLIRYIEQAIVSFDPIVVSFFFRDLLFLSTLFHSEIYDFMKN